MQEVTDAQEDRRLTEEYMTHDLKKRTWSNRWICIKMKNSASTLKFLVESLFKFFCCFIRFDWWFTTCRFFWVTVKIKVENFDWWKCLLVVIRSLFCNFFGSLINTLLLFSVTLIFILNEKDLCLRITARIKPRVLFSGITISLHISYSVMETCHWQIDRPIISPLSTPWWDQLSKSLQYFISNKEWPVLCNYAERLLIYLQSDVEAVWWSHSRASTAGNSTASNLQQL